MLEVADAVEARCANCAEVLRGAYCSQCGQHVRDLHRPFGQLVSELFEHALSVDTRLARTIRPLLLRPGEVPRAYLAGRRVTYLPPLRAYLISAVVFFGLFTVLPPGNPRVVVGTRGSAELAAARSAGGSMTTFELPEHTPFFDEAYQRSLARAKQNPQAFARAAYASVPRLFFLFLPLFALFLEVFYRKQGYYFDHLVFALYYHAFVFLVLAAVYVTLWTDEWTPALVSTPLTLLLVAWLMAYLPLALRRAYGGSWPMTLLKVSGLGVLYFLAVMSLGGLLTAAWAILTI